MMVDWDFLLYMLHGTGLGLNAKNGLVLVCLLFTSPFSLTGPPKGFFPPLRGLRQGDPPFLFVFVGEALGRMVDAVRSARNAPLTFTIC